MERDLGRSVWSEDFQHTSYDWSSGAKTYLGNGNVGLESHALGIGPGRSFMAGILDLTPIDITRPAALPEWSSLKVSLDGQLVDDLTASIDASTYRQTLHMDIGELTTAYDQPIGENRWTVNVRQIVARHEPGLSITILTLSSTCGGTVDINAAIRENDEPKRYPFRTLKEVPNGFGGGFFEKRMEFRWHPGHVRLTNTTADGELAVLSVSGCPDGNGPALGISSAIRTNLPLSWSSVVSSTSTEMSSSCKLDAREQLVLTRYTTFERDAPPDVLINLANYSSQAARSIGFDQILKKHRHAWSKIWLSDIEIAGDPKLQKQARTDLFYLFQSRGADPRWSMPIFGIASSGYNGGIFWDADVFIYPALLPLDLDFARGFVEFRHRTLPGAVTRAQSSGYAGAKYAWEANLIDGEENIAPVDNILASGQIHNNSGIAMAQWMYFCATGDKEWLRDKGFPVIAAIADFWVSRALWSEDKNQFEILAVFSVEESDGIVDNCTYTNASAARTLSIAEKAAKVLDLPARSAWSTVAKNMRIPRNDTTGQYRSSESGSGPSLWSSVLMFHPLEWPTSMKEMNQAQMEPYFWDMSLQPVVAAMCGDSEKMREYLDVQSSRFVHAPFSTRGEQAENDAVPMHTGCGCNLQAWIYGATGLRWRTDGLKPVYPACLPDRISSVTFKKMTWLGQDWRVVVNQDGLTITPLGKP